MGYRSQVGAVIYGTKENLDAYLTMHEYVLGTKILEYFVGNLARYTTTSYDHKEIHVLYLSLEDSKWYESFEDVRTWMNFMTGSNEMNLEWEFIRVGEETGDIIQDSSTNATGLLYVYNPLIGEDFDMINQIPILPGVPA